MTFQWPPIKLGAFYALNVRGGDTTFCPRCGEAVIQREPVLVNRLEQVIILPCA